MNGRIDSYGILHITKFGKEFEQFCCYVSESPCGAVCPFFNTRNNSVDICQNKTLMFDKLIIEVEADGEEK